MPNEEDSSAINLISILQQRNQKLLDRENELAEKQEELQSQKEELTAAIEELVIKNNRLTEALQQLQTRNQELDQLLYRTSHDLKTPVSSLEGLLHLMKSETLSESQITLLQYMDQKISQMNDVLKSLAMLAEVSFEKIVLQQVNLRQLATQVINDLSYLPNFSSVKIEFNYNGLEEVRNDEQVLYNVLKCLVSNAIIFRDPLELGWVGINFSNSGKFFLIEVLDDGEGISPTISNDIFKMFFRGSEKSHGAGLGLYIVKSVVKRMNGEVRWTSKEGKTTFQVALPIT